jgi:hypothetical protein
MGKKKEFVDYALDYASRGWAVFSLTPKEKKPLPGTRGFHDATTNDRIIERMWDNTPKANIGVATGKISGIFVFDIDGPEGAQSLTAFETKFGPLPETLEQTTGKGRQLFFLMPEREIRNRQSLMPGIDIRGTGGYVVIAPSIHPNGKAYAWPYGDDTNIAPAPKALLDLINPPKKNVAPWEKLASKQQAKKPVQTTEQTTGLTGMVSVMERARLYLDKCAPAIQGAGGHDALLWAAKALVVGFELDDSSAISLLWSNYNPRCSPPWDPSNKKEKRDFERKVEQARNLPSQKPRGWLLDEYSLRSSEDSIIAMAKGQATIQNLLASNKKKTETEVKTVSPSKKIQEFQQFPINFFPKQLKAYCKEITNAMDVDSSFVALPMLVTAAGAMGNAWRIQIKNKWIEPPTLWGGVIGNSGTNKSAPMDEVIKPLKLDILLKDIKNPLLCPICDVIIDDATTEAIVSALSNSAKGLLSHRDELASWVNTFDSYRKAGADEQIWISFWNAKEYKVNRKTNDEVTKIPAASVSLLGGIQPDIFIKCFDPGKFASGLVPRLLVVCPPERQRKWNDSEISDESIALWEDVIMKLRLQNFASFDPNAQKFQPNILTLSKEAKTAYTDWYTEMCTTQFESLDKNEKSFISKAQTTVVRLCLIHRGMLLALDDKLKITDPIEKESMDAGLAWGNWFLNEQMRIYGFSSKNYNTLKTNELHDKLRSKYSKNDVICARHITWCNTKRYPRSKEALDAMAELVDNGLAYWVENSKNKIKLN